ncbi:PLP-dependent transferase [Opitutus sp. ER46]|uniref:PLP-dependent transferase n=1 Tax=Opitutus sp. ER46 TaxID=2161864 RepID=UPI000D3173DA|nr:PLP-dependent transferase [Opitutus sp. ER46]PTX98444.1 PLP-dependent transferase [Opitutus sp. ER46]
MSFTRLPLGQPIPARPHAVSCSLPTMQDVLGYEEKNPATMRHVGSAYPRFVVHPFARQLARHLAENRPELAGRTLWLTSSARMAEALIACLGDGVGAKRFEDGRVHGVSHPADAADVAQKAKVFLQNIGGFLSSREAEDELVARRVLPGAAPETLFAGNAAAEVRRCLQPAFPECAAADLLLANTGMNAMYAAYRASAELQAARGRTVWIQLGWLYRDTIAILQRFASKPDDYVYLRDPLDEEAITRIFQRFGARIAGVVSELPTNPLIQTPNLALLGRLCRQHGAHLLVDPSVASPYSVSVLPEADLVINSLTKYTASEGDIIAGLVAVNPAGRDAAALRARVAELLEPVYPRDLARLAAEIGETETVLATIQRNVAQVVGFLEQHPAVREVFWARHAASRENFARIARLPASAGGMLSFTLRVPMTPVYDALRLPKGPSFGMKTTLLCPFIYLAHFELATTPAGVAELAASRIDPELLRLCVGTEPAEEIIGALAEALAAGGRTSDVRCQTSEVRSLKPEA